MSNAPSEKPAEKPKDSVPESVVKDPVKARAELLKKITDSKDVVALNDVAQETLDEEVKEAEVRTAILNRFTQLSDSVENNLDIDTRLAQLKDRADAIRVIADLHNEEVKPQENVASTLLGRIPVIGKLLSGFASVNGAKRLAFTSMASEEGNVVSRTILGALGWIPGVKNSLKTFAKKQLLQADFEEAVAAKKGFVLTIIGEIEDKDLLSFAELQKKDSSLSVSSLLTKHLSTKVVQRVAESQTLQAPIKLSFKDLLVS